MNQSSFVCSKFNGFKYWYPILIILFNINHLLAHSLNSFKYCCLSTIDSQQSSSSTFKIKRTGCLPQEQFEKYVQANHVGARAWYNQRIDLIGPLQLLILPSKGEIWVLQVTWPLWLLGHGLLNHHDSILKHYRLPYLPTPPLGQDMTQGQFLSGV